MKTIIFPNGLTGPVTAVDVREVAQKLDRSARAVHQKAYQLKTIKPEPVKTEPVRETITGQKLIFYTRKELQPDYYEPEVKKPKGNLSVQFPIDRVKVKDGFIVFHFNQTQHRMLA